MTTPTTHKLTVRGLAVTTRTPRRFAAIYLRPTAVTVEGEGTYVAFAEVIKRTDSLATAKAAARRRGFGYHGSFAVVVDLDTGMEV